MAFAVEILMIGYNPTLFNLQMVASRLDNLDSDLKSGNEGFPSNISKWILWQDPIYSLFEVQYKNLDLEQHFDKVKIPGSILDIS